MIAVFSSVLASTKYSQLGNANNFVKVAKYLTNCKQDGNYNLLCKL